MSYTILGTLFALVAGGLFVSPYWAPPDDNALDLEDEVLVKIDRETVPVFEFQNEELEEKEEMDLFNEEKTEFSSEEEISFTSEFRATERPRWFQQNRLRREGPLDHEFHNDPRYASPDHELVCLKNKKRNFYIEETRKSIGCCPEGDPNGKPFPAGQACCCGKIFNEQNQFCCEETCEVMLSGPKEKKQCKRQRASKEKDEQQRIIKSTQKPTTSTTTTSTTSTTSQLTTIKSESVPLTFTTFTTEDSSPQCPKLWDKKPKLMKKECDQLGNGIETCSISCPEGTRVNGTESLACIGKFLMQKN